jgi:hypothetical protein
MEQLDLRAIAYHEAGHAVIAAVLGILGDNSRVTIVPAERGKGFFDEKGSVEFSKDTSNYAWKRWGVSYTRKAILAFYAGPAVSIKLDPSLDLFEEGGWYELDMILAEDFCKWIGDPAYYEGDKKLVLETQNWKKAVALVESNWPSINALAEQLLKCQTMTGAEVKATLSSGAKQRTSRSRRLEQ